MLREAHLCTQNTTSTAAMLHFATFMFGLERRPFSCQCTFPRTHRGGEHAPMQTPQRPPPTTLSVKEWNLSAARLSILNESAASSKAGEAKSNTCTSVTSYRRGPPVLTRAGSFFSRLQGNATKPAARHLQRGWIQPMKNASITFTYSSGRRIFLLGRPLETWHSHARRPATTLPTRFSIKQANNTIPTPINK